MLKGVCFIHLISACLLFASINTVQAKVINMVAIEDHPSYAPGGDTYEAINTFVAELDGFQLKFRYYPFTRVWDYMAKGKDLCHFFSVPWPTDKLIASRYSTLQLYGPFILIRKEAIKKHNIIPPYTTDDILQDKRLTGAKIEARRFNYVDHLWLTKLEQDNKQNIVSSAFSPQQIINMLFKHRFDYLISSPEILESLPISLKNNLDTLPLTRGAQSYTQLRLSCNDNSKNKQLIKQVDQNITKLYKNPYWQNIWANLGFKDNENGESAMQLFIERQSPYLAD